MTRPRISKSDAAVCAAIALAAHYFPGQDDAGRPVGTFRHAAFLVSGQLDKWSEWAPMPQADKQRIAAVLGFAPEELAKASGFTSRARALLANNDCDEDAGGGLPLQAAGQSVATTVGAVPLVGGDLLGYVDRLIDRVRKDHRRARAVKPATPGIWHTHVRYSPKIGAIQGTSTIPAYDFDDPLADLPTVITVPYHAQQDIPTSELLGLAEDIDGRYEPQDRYVHKVLTSLFEQLDTNDTVAATTMLRLLSGATEVFNAPTGTGKSVLVRVAASWFALNDLTVSIVLPNVEATLSATWDIWADLAHLRSIGRLLHDRTCSALMSPDGMLDRAEKAVTRFEGNLLSQPAKALWKLDQMSYGCALAHHTRATAPYPNGQESCHRLTPLPPEQGVRTCPWITTCGKYEQQRQACTASVIVTNHHNFMAGRLKIGVNLDGRATAHVSIAELVLRRSHAVMIDEVDQFQSTALDMCTSDLILASRRSTKVPLRELDADIASLPNEAIKDLLPTISHARYLSEFLLAGICQQQIHLRHYSGRNPVGEAPGVSSTGWHLVGSRDRRLIGLLFPHDHVDDDKEIPAELFDRLNALRPEPPLGTGLPRSPQIVTLPAHLLIVRDILEKLLAPRGEDLLAHVQLELDDALSGTIKDAHERAEAAELLIVRTWLAELDDALDLLRQKTAQLRAAGLDSARKVAERLGSSIASDILPYGMLGKAIVGYRVTGLEEPDQSAELTAQSVTGDPHTYTAQLGSIVSLVMAGVERPVMGLSATAYFPQAVREHIHSEVKWWMTDAAPDSIRAQRHPITSSSDSDTAIRISGLPQALKRDALMNLGDRLYDTEIHPALQRIVDRDRAHAAVVVNSYEHCRYLAMGIYSAGLYTEGLCVAVPGDRSRREKLPPLPPGIVELTPEEFEDFPNRGNVLVVPMARIARGLNIVIGTKSAITPVYLCTRPLALMSDAAEMYGSVHVAGLNAMPRPSSDPLHALELACEASWKRLGLIMRSAAGFINTSPELQEEIVAGMIVDMVQLAGRARRGGTDMTLHLVDHAFHEDAWQADLGNILRRMHAAWSPEVRHRMNQIYREALAAFLAYAGIDTTEPNAI